MIYHSTIAFVYDTNIDEWMVLPWLAIVHVTISLIIFDQTANLVHFLHPFNPFTKMHHTKIIYHETIYRTVQVYKYQGKNTPYKINNKHNPSKEA